HFPPPTSLPQLHLLAAPAHAALPPAVRTAATAMATRTWWASSTPPPHLSSLVVGIPSPHRAPLGCASGGTGHGDPRMVGEATMATMADAHSATLFWASPLNIPTATYLMLTNRAPLQCDMFVGEDLVVSTGIEYLWFASTQTIGISLASSRHASVI
ncbi:unnamed protein product, partial [Urochloa humidicola]